MKEDVRQRIDDQILWLYRSIRYPVFPIDPMTVVRKIPGCRYITYDQLAAVSGTDYQSVVKACESIDGCTQYEPKTGHYLIAINTSKQYGASKARIRWTTAHELGHVSAGHFTEPEYARMNMMDPSLFYEMEEEADYFAASFLAPIPAILTLRARKPADIRDWFGLSQIASEYRWADMLRWTYDQRLADYFRYFRPVSDVKEAKRLSTYRMDVLADSDELI